MTAQALRAKAKVLRHYALLLHLGEAGENLITARDTLGRSPSNPESYAAARRRSGGAQRASAGEAAGAGAADAGGGENHSFKLQLLGQAGYPS